MTNPSQELATYASQINIADVPPRVLDKAKMLLLDFIGYTAAAKDVPSAQILRAYAKTKGAREEATVFAGGFKTSVELAALVNGAMGHMIELDDTHRATASHIGDSVFAAALAMGERLHATGEQVLLACIAGFEVAGRVGYAAMRSHYDLGWHSSGTLGPFGAAVAAGKLLGLDAIKMNHAIGLATTQAAGSFAHLSNRSMAKDFNTGRAAASGILAAELAAIGFTAGNTSIQHPRGFLGLYAQESHPEKLTAGLGTHFVISEIAHKLYPGCFHVFSARETTLRIMAENGLQASDVAHVEARIFATGARMVDEPTPWLGDKGLQGALFSAQFLIALAMAGGYDALRKSFDDRYIFEMMANETVRRLTGLVTVIADAELDQRWPATTPARVILTTTDGRRFEDHTDFPKGEPENPANWDDIRAKFILCLEKRYGLDTCRIMIRRIEAVSDCQDIAELIAMVRE